MITGNVWNLEGGDKVQELYCLPNEQKLEVVRLGRDSRFLE
jgi:hypothetical protein